MPEFTEIEVVENLPYESFYRDYVARQKPVVLGGAIDHLPARHWTPEGLRDRLGGRTVRYRHPSGRMEPVELGAVLDRILAGEKGIYLRNINIPESLPELMDDIRPEIVYARGCWKRSPLVPRNWLLPAERQELFIGGEGVRFPVVHRDYFGKDALLTQICGEKLYLLYPPEQAPLLYPRAENPLLSAIEDPDAPDLSRYPDFTRARAMGIRLPPGYTLYIPNDYWHTTRIITPSISFHNSIWHRYNWGKMLFRYRRIKEKSGGNPVKTALVTTYGRLVAGVLPWFNSGPMTRRLQRRTRGVRGYRFPHEV